MDQAVVGGGATITGGREDDEDEFCSCCEDEEEVWKESEQLAVEELKDECDESSVKMFFKGVSISGIENSASGFSGIGVFMERPSGLPVIRVQKKLDFYAEEPLADYLALIDGLLEAQKNNVRRVYAFTDSQLLYDQVG